MTSLKTNLLGRRGQIKKSLLYPVAGGVLMGLFVGNFSLASPLVNGGSLISWPGYIAAIAAVAVLLKMVFNRVQQANARNFANVLEQRARLEKLLERVINAQEDERTRLAMELHDSPVQWLTSVVYRLEACQEYFKRGMLEKVQNEMEQIQNVLDTTLAELRHAASALHPPELEKVGLVKAIARYADTFERDTEIACLVEETGAVPRLPAPVELAVFRVVQESLSNIRKHSQASRVKINLGLGGRMLRASITDNGVGFEQDESREGSGAENLGLPGMGERARMIGGTLSVRSAPNAGTQVILMVPYTESQETPTEEAPRPAASKAEPLRQGMQVKV